MTRKRSLVVAAFATLAVTATIFALRASRSRPGVTHEDFERLRAGMTQAEVEETLFGPPRNDLRYAAIVWAPRASGPPVSAEIAPAAPAIEWFAKEDKPANVRRGVLVASAINFFPRETSTSGRQAVWVTRTGLVAVYFGDDGRLVHRYSSKVYETTAPSVFDRFASRPRTKR